MPRKSVQRMMEDAEALDELEDGLEVQTKDDVVTGEERTQARDLGLGVAPVKATNEADKMVALHHIMDGRIVRVPKYMVPKMLAFRFPVDNDIPSEFHRKRVWSTRNVDAPQIDRPFRCALSVYATDEQKAEMAEAGMRSLCRKAGSFATQFEANEHFRIKHRRSWAAYQLHLTQKQARDAAASTQELLRTLAAAIGPRVVEEVPEE